MRKIIILIISLSNLAFSSIVINQQIKNFELLDQFETKHQITKETNKLIFAFQKDTGHLVKDFLATKESTYLKKKNILFIADFSNVPSFIKLIIFPITGYDYPIIILDNNKLSNYYKNEKYKEKIMIITLEKFNVVDIKYIDNVIDLKKVIE